MNIELNKKDKKGANEVLVFDSIKTLKKELSPKELKAISIQVDQNKYDLSILGKKKYAVILDKNNFEKNRKIGSSLLEDLYGKVTLIDNSSKNELIASLLEGMILKSYSFVPT